MVLQLGHHVGGRKWLVSIDTDCFSALPARGGWEFAYDSIRDLNPRVNSRILS